MAMVYSSEALDVIQRALYQLRQDVDLPSESEAETDTSTLWLKCKAAFETAANEVYYAMDWGDFLNWRDVGQWTPWMQNALVYCTARELAVPVAGRVGDLQNMEALYLAKLREAELKTLEESRALLEGDDAEVMAMVLPDFALLGDKLPRSLKSLTDRLGNLATRVRRSLLSIQAWSFAEREIEVDPFDADLRMPAGAVNLVAVYGRDGERLNEWRVVGRLIRAHEPISRIVYVTDVEDTGEWPDKARDAYLTRLAADFSFALGLQSAQMWEGKAAVALEAAKVNDSRAQNTPHRAHGRNYYLDQMMAPRRHSHVPLEI